MSKMLLAAGAGLALVAGCGLVRTGEGEVRGGTDIGGTTILEDGEELVFISEFAGGWPPFVLQVFGPRLGGGERLMVEQTAFNQAETSVSFQPYLSGDYRVALVDALGQKVEWVITIGVFARPHQAVFPPE